MMNSGLLSGVDFERLFKCRPCHAALDVSDEGRARLNELGHVETEMQVGAYHDIGSREVLSQ